MKVSEYIKKLELLLAEHGDLECVGFYGYEQSIREMKPPTLEHRKFYEIGDPKTLATHEMWDEALDQFDDCEKGEAVICLD